MPVQDSYDAVIVGGGHNGLVAAAYLARAGRSVLVLERLDHTGGAAVSTRPFAGVDARLSRYSYLVSLLPQSIVRDLGLDFAVRKRTVSSYTPSGSGGLLVGGGTDRTRESFARLTGGDAEFASWQSFYAVMRRVAERVFPTLTEPLPTREALRARIGDEAAWRMLCEEPLGVAIEEHFAHDLVRGVVLTDALIGTFAGAHDPTLPQNRCFLYHVIGGGTGDWDVPVGGMGALTDALAKAAGAAGAEIVTGHEATRIYTDGRHAEVTFRSDTGEGAVAARHVLVNASPEALATLLGEATSASASASAEGAQLKVNMLLRRLPRLRDRSVAPEEAFAGTFHVAEGYGQLAAAYEEAASGRLPGAPPSEIYCHSLTDPSILGPELAAQGYQTLTLFGLHTPARLFTHDNEAARAELLAATLAQLDTYLEEPLTDCLALDANGRPCIEAKTPLDLESELRLPGGNIFHRPLSFPYADESAGTGRWGVETAHANVLLCGAGAVRGGGVSGIPGHNAAMAVLGR
ncbi:NAD(P)/FAD-dependent oxidoreductase [Streptomyces sp. ISL-99]|uniref:phytoene desaturase family protein n=1 Tax=Streptomyces sp. ISL-99 TaxID=2819193 RepID=UPI001BECF427|nr:NAD(P)/FAD-dependent oxidoreductase [Streptomyces sp. ISL-99]MBT2524455.1 NAD(P)/FAD-dependent oxidoreductase [Streptomyces sp. ISL-99]